MSTRMMERNTYGHSAAAMIFGWLSSLLAGLWLAMPPWVEKLTQFLWTLLCGLITLTVSHFYRRLLRRFFPDKGQGDKGQGEQD